MAHHEIEIKYLIAMPDVKMLEGMAGCCVWKIEQIYMLSEPGTTRRVRKVVENGEERYYRTFKRRVSALTAEEDEKIISREEYDACCALRNPELNAVLKTRYRVPYAEQLLEFDVYPFWTDRAIMEIELESEDQPIEIPEWVTVIKDVTSDFRYKNYALARAIPMDEI